MNNEGTFCGALAEFRQALADLWWVVICDIGRAFLSLGHMFVDSALEAQADDEPGLINDACNALDSLSSYNPVITVNMRNEFSAELESVIRDIALE